MSSEVCILLGVWGEKYINDFLQLSLPSLLAPGNIPVLAHAYNTRFVFLTRSYDISIFENNTAFKKLQACCEIQFITINDLTGIGNYSTTLTLAYDRAIRQTGTAMLHTYFIFLTSDYIMADGSFKGLMTYMQRGYSGICAGNFQVTQENIEPYLRRRINADTGVMAIKPRELLELSLEHLHPVTMTSFCDQSLVHNYRANRFFYRHDQHTIAGRFYLLHMLCIKPETMDYHVGAFCDYAFIPEMCPSGNIAIITDSDEYFVVEVQSKQHELTNTRPGSINFKKLALSLAEWSTEQHRHNAEKTIYFHANDISQQDKQIIDARLNLFMSQFTTRLQHYPMQPYRNHPYWFNAVKTIEQKKDKLDYEYHDITELTTSSFKKWYQRLFGKAPAVFRWHYRYREYSMIRRIFEQFSHETLVLYSSQYLLFMHYTSWLKHTLGLQHHYDAQRLAFFKDKIKALQADQFKNCIFFARLEDLSQVKTTLNLLKTILAPTGKVLILVPNDNNRHFLNEVVYRVNAMMNTPYRVTDITTIHDNLARAGSMTINAINHQFDYSKKLKFLSYLIAGLPGALVSLIRNSLPRFSHRQKGYCTDVLITLEPVSQTGNVI